MFATKILIAAGIAASSLAFTSAPANAATHVSISLGAPAVTYYTPAQPAAYYAPVVTYSAPAPVCTTPVVVAPAPVVVYERDRHPDFRISFFDWHHDRDGFRGDFRHDHR